MYKHRHTQAHMHYLEQAPYCHFSSAIQKLPQGDSRLYLYAISTNPCFLPTCAAYGAIAVNAFSHQRVLHYRYAGYVLLFFFLPLPVLV